MSNSTVEAILSKLAVGEAVRVVGLVTAEERKHWFGDLWTRLHYQPGIVLSIHSEIATKITKVRLLLDRGAAELGPRPCDAVGLPEYDARRHWSYPVTSVELAS